MGWPCAHLDYFWEFHSEPRSSARFSQVAGWFLPSWTVALSQGIGGPSSSCLCARIYLCLGAWYPRAPSPFSGDPASPRQVAFLWALFLLLEPLAQLQGGPDSQTQKVSTEFVTPSGRGRLGDTVWKNALPGVHHVLQSWQDLIIFHLFHWSIVDSQCIHFCSIAKWFNYINTYILCFHILFHYGYHRILNIAPWVIQ